MAIEAGKLNAVIAHRRELLQNALEIRGRFFAGGIHLITNHSLFHGDSSSFSVDDSIIAHIFLRFNKKTVPNRRVIFAPVWDDFTIYANQPFF